MPNEVLSSAFARLTPQERSILVTGVYLRNWRIEFCDGREGEYGYIYRNGFDTPASWVVSKRGHQLVAFDQAGVEVATTPMVSELIYHLAGTLPQVSGLDQLGIRRVAKLMLDCYGQEAPARAADYADKSQSAADREGAKAWGEVLKIIEEMQRDWLHELIVDELFALVARH